MVAPRQEPTPFRFSAKRRLIIIRTDEVNWCKRRQLDRHLVHLRQSERRRMHAETVVDKV